ncbi:MAG: hypothetical protein H7289_07055 [Mucilaginibacter sp.]|nr:hypothetical protein [Mucilaginibacter sp.]
MGWTIILEDERGAAITSIEVELSDLIFDHLDKGTYKLIKYLDPYGDTTFNLLQIDDLVSDLEKIQRIKHNNKIPLITELALRCKAGQHTYLTFYGE